MKCYLSFCATITTILCICIHPSKVACSNSCSYNDFDIISLMGRDPENYQRNPCYIQWKAEQDAKLKQIWARQAELERSIARNRAAEEGNRSRERENRQNSYTNYVQPKKALPASSAGVIIGVICAIITGICFCGACIAFCRNDDDSTALPTTNANYRSNPYSAGLSVVATAPVTATSNNNTNQIETEYRGPSSIRVFNAPTPEPVNPFLSQGVINRQDSLPSYDDAVRMPSAPPKV